MPSPCAWTRLATCMSTTRRRRIAPQPGTRITLTVPTADQDCDADGTGVAPLRLFNPHVSVKICEEPHAGLACLPTDDDCGDFYQSTVTFPGDWRKYFPTDLTSAWWYSPDDLTRLIFSHIGASKQRGRPGSLAAGVREAVSQPLGQCQSPGGLCGAAWDHPS